MSARDIDTGEAVVILVGFMFLLGCAITAGAMLAGWPGVFLAIPLLIIGLRMGGRR